MNTFNLGAYLLNESLQSSILYNDILRDKTQLFTYLQSEVNGSTSHTIYSDIDNLIKKCNDCISTLFSASFLNHANIKDDNFIYDGSEVYGGRDNNHLAVYYSLSDKEIIKINQKYNNAIQVLLKKCKNLFNKPHIAVLGGIINRGYATNMDLANLTDSNFKKYTKKDIKRIGGLPKGNIYFWFQHDGSLLGITTLEHIIMRNPLVYFDDSNIKYTLEKAKEIVNDKKNIIKYTINTKLKDGQILSWPLLKPFDSVYGSYDKTPFSELFSSLKYNNYANTSIYRRDGKKPGNPLSSQSNLRKIVGWGTSNEDYVIVIIPDKDLQNKDSSIDYNFDRTHSLSQNRKRNYYDSIDYNRYKWTENKIFQLQPYRMNDSHGKQQITFYNKETNKFEIKTLSEYSQQYKNYYGFTHVENPEIYFIDNADEYNRLYRENNIKRYNALKSLNTANSEVKHLLAEIKKYQASVQEILSHNAMLLQQFKQLMKTQPISIVKQLNAKINGVSVVDKSLTTITNEITAILIKIELDYDTLISYVQKTQKLLLNNDPNKDKHQSSIKNSITNIKEKFTELDNNIKNYQALAENITEELDNY